MLLTACGGSVSTSNDATSKTGTSGANASDCGTLEMAFNFDMQVPDPDVFYQADGLNVTQGAYEGCCDTSRTPNRPRSSPPSLRATTSLRTA